VLLVVQSERVSNGEDCTFYTYALLQWLSVVGAIVEGPSGTCSRRLGASDSDECSCILSIPSSETVRPRWLSCVKRLRNCQDRTVDLFSPNARMSCQYLTTHSWAHDDSLRLRDMFFRRFLADPLVLLGGHQLFYELDTVYQRPRARNSCHRRAVTLTLVTSAVSRPSKVELRVHTPEAARTLLFRL
jgi:hypothetical protein